MAASAKVLTLDSRTCNGDWTVVLPRRGKHRRNFPKIRTPEEQQQPWCPSDLKRDTVVESRLIQKLQTCIKKVESSQFYRTLMDQIQSPEIMDRICRVLGSEMNMKMVVYGIGSIEAYESPRFQLSLALLMKRKFSWIGDIEVFDPILSATELRVLEALGCSVLSVNEQGRRHAVKPTLFYMPHCEANLYDNLLQVNWEMEQLNHIILFGNSFETYQQYVSEFTSSSVADSARHILAAQKFTDEFPVRIVSDDYYAAFHDSSLHFLSPVIETELPLI